MNPIEFETSPPPSQGAIEPAQQGFKLRHALALIGSIAITVAIFLFHERLGNLQSLSYVGAFLAMLLGNATIILPVPGLIIVYLLGARGLDPVLLGLAAGPGAALGELTGYFAGYGGSALISNVRLYERIQGWMSRFGLVVITVLAIIPNPIFDMAGIVAGTMKIKWWQFLLAALLGKTLQAILIAQAGAFSLEWVRGFLE